MTDRELMQQALEALEGWANHGEWVWPESALEQAKRNTTESIAALRERLAQPEQEPVWIQPNHLQLARRAPFLCRVEPKQRDDFVPLYTTPPQPEQNEFNPDWDAMAVMVEEQQRMAKRIAELEAQQKPVAWLHTKIEGVAVPHRPADLDKHPDRWEALYKTPPPCPTCEALARTVMLDQTYHDAHRKPLTDEEIADLWSAQIFHITDLKLAKDFVRDIEAAHGIKD